jgi:hypothetical protein
LFLLFPHCFHFLFVKQITLIGEQNKKQYPDREFVLFRSAAFFPTGIGVKNIWLQLFLSARQAV